MEKLIEGKCEACKADAPLVTPEERKTLMPQIPGWDVICLLYTSDAADE